MIEEMRSSLAFFSGRNLEPISKCGMSPVCLLLPHIEFFEKGKDIHGH